MPVLAPLLLAAASTLVVPTSRGDQSLALYPPASTAQAPARSTLVLILSGEGGWRSFDDKLAGWLSSEGYWVGGIDCMHYFWKPQDDRSILASDVRLYADALAKAAGASEGVRVVLAGFSFGADLAPWVAGAPARDRRIAGLVMIGPDKQGSLAFRISEMMGFVPKDHVFDTATALTEAREVPILFVHGGGDSTSQAPSLAEAFPGPKELIVVPGADHHFSGREDELRRAVIGGLGRLLSR